MNLYLKRLYVGTDSNLVFCSQVSTIPKIIYGCKYQLEKGKSSGSKSLYLKYELCLDRYRSCNIQIHVSHRNAFVTLWTSRELTEVILQSKLCRMESTLHTSLINLVDKYYVIVRCIVIFLRNLNMICFDLYMSFFQKRMIL